MQDGGRAASFRPEESNAGVISAIVLYVPLGSLTIIRALDQARHQVARGVALGVLLHAAVFVIAFASTR
jgi:hypothetical protein